LNIKGKISRLNYNVDLEPQFNLTRDNFEHPYARTDLLELFADISLYLKGKNLDDKNINQT
jgi:hypothetical protein